METTNDRLVEALRTSLKEAERLRQQNSALLAASSEPIAIVGAGCRFPGGVTGPEEFWDLVAGGVDAVGAFPADRGWEAFEEAFGRGQTYRRQGGFVYDATEFDAGFFGISPREALAMDPQQRLLLETSWEAIEHGGIDPKSLHGSMTGVFIGANTSGYSSVLPVEDESLDGYRLIGAVSAVASGRISYCLGLTGPAVTVDTACSSSLVAMHQAILALRSGECSMALAGGVAVMVSPGAFMEFGRQGGMASSGRSKAFSEEADGIGWGEGAGMVLLERLSDARRNGHQVLAVIRGSAANQDGASNGLAAPNGPSQRRVIRAALANAQLSAADVDVVEAHGTGTTLGDPIEAQALLATYGQAEDRAADRPLWLGSVKSNIGHSQCAAGVAGVIKMVMALRHEVLPRTLFAEEPSSHVDWTSGNVRLLSEPVEWPAGERPRRAGVSAFGVSGTNVHLIVEEAPAAVEPEAREARVLPVFAGGASAWPVSGQSAAALAGQAGRLREHVAERPELSVGDVAWSLATTRAALERRAVVLGADRDELAAGLTAVATGQPAAGVVTGSVAAAGVGRTVFVFPGQGSQWVGMGRELAEASPVFAARLAECAAALAPYVEWQLGDVLAGRHGFEAADVVQPALWAVMVSLAAVWQAAGVAPDAVLGHSQGEIAAAAVAGILSLDDAAKVVALRSKTLKALAGRGGMLSIGEPVDGVRARIASYGTRLSVAAVNGPSATVVSGDADALRELADSCGESPRARMIPVDYASHSAHVDELREEILSVLQGIAPTEARIPMVSALTGAWLSGPELDPAYWYASLRETVEFDRAVRILGDAGHGVFLEVSPHPVLTPAIGDSLEDRSPVVVGTLRRDEGGAQRLLTSLAEAYVQGAPVDWAAVLGAGTAVALPTYAFQRRRYWPEAPAVERAKLSVDDWRYRITWQPSTARGPADLSGTWLVVGDGPEAATVAEALAGQGAEVVTAAGPERLGAVPAEGVAGVVSLLALDETPLADHPLVQRGLAETVELVQALGRAGVTAPLWVLTRGAVAVGPDEVTTSPVQTQVWGLGRTVGLEHADRWGGLVDLPPVVDADAAARLVGVFADGSEDQVAVRPSGVFLRRLVRAEARRVESEDWSPRGTVLLTGGSGAIGVVLGPWLAEHGAPRVVLTSRSGPSAPGVAALAATLAQAGSAVEVVSCDLSVREQVTGMVTWIEASGPGLSTVLHSANTPFLARLEDTDRDGLALAVGAKAAGAVHLDEATAHLGIDEFVMFSSISATWGSNDHAAYAAGNSFLDGLAEDRRARGLPGTSIAWGVWNTRDWDAVDAAMDQAPGRVTPHRLLRQGMNFLDTQRALTALAEVLADDETFIAVADVEWEKFAPVFTAARPRPLLDTIPEAQEDTAPRTVDDQRNEFAARLAGLSAAERRRTVVELVRTQAAAVLGHESADEIVASRAFRELGFDSLTAVELRNRLNAAVGVRLPSTVIFDHPSASALADEILAALFGTDADEDQTVTAAAVSTDPIAIVGMACRYPGGVRTPEELWDLLAAGGDAIGAFPADRGWDVDALFDPDPDAEGSTYVVEGGFLSGAAEFDAGFFGISPREALAMDPQQRLLLETSWEAVERAGIDPKSLHGSATGVFVGAASSGYIGAASGEAGAQAHLITGNALSVLSGRISYSLGLVGPAVTVDTACSSSLVALHQAVQALRSGECDVALAGGVTVMADPGEFVGFSRLRALASDGRCKAFGEGADGMGIGEGAGMLVLERLSEAQRKGRRVLGLVRGCAINQDGASNGLTAPNGPAQRRVIRAALANARISAADVDVVEAHGTGTELGDPIEAGALLATYGQERFEDRPLWLGSVKSNIGHAQQAAGVAGVIKMVLALRAGVLPKTLHADEPSSHVDWETGNVRLLQEQVAWPAGERPRRAGVSAFGISGTNAHVIIEEAPAAIDASAPDPATAVESGVQAWVVSGRSATALAGQAGRLREHVLARPELPVGDVAWSLATTRAALEHRAVVLGGERSELAAGLVAVATGQPAAGVVTGSVAAAGVGRTVFVFPGQGSQWVGMGRELVTSSPVFAARLAECAAALAPYVDWQLDDVLAGLHGFEAADVVQPALWAVMVSLAAVWEAAGVAPDAVVGHSQGEIAAAAVAGILSLDDAAKVVALRSKTLKALAGRGGMLSIAEPVAGVRARIASYGSRLSIAAVNGPSATVVSGDADALRELADACGDSPRARMIPVDYASHSAHVDELREEILSVLQGIAPTEARIPMVSALTGAWLSGPELDPAYWYASLRETVEFDRAVRILGDAGHGVFLEVSPHPVLTPAIGDALEDRSPVVVGTLRRDEGGAQRLLTSLAEAYVRGLPVDWAGLLGGGLTVDLPTYAFQHRHYWPEAVAEVAEGSVVDAEFWAAVEGGDADGLAAALNIDGDRLGEVLPALADYRRRERAGSAVADWRYRVSWAPVSESNGVLAGTWLLVGDGTDAGVVAKALADHGADVVTADRPDRIGQTVAACSDLRGVVSLLALDESPEEAGPWVSRGGADTLALVQELGRLGVSAPLWVVTRGAVRAVAGDVVRPMQAQLWGLGAVAALELAGRWGGLIDLPAAVDARTGARLVSVLVGDEDQVAVRAGGVVARRLVRAGRPVVREAWSPRGSVLVTGGTSGVGAITAQWVADRGASRVVLTSRSGPGAAGVAELAASIAARGAAVEVVSCDIADRASVAEILDRIDATGPALSSVVHSAGTGGRTPVEQLSVAELSRLLSAKVGGAVVLDELTAGRDLDAFVLFSSGAGVWGSGALAGYAAANAHLDALVEDRRSRGLVASSVAWGLWAGVGMAAGSGGERLREFGMEGIDGRRGMLALGQVLDAGEGAMVVAGFDWPQFVPTYTLHRASRLLADLPEVRAVLAAEAAVESTTEEVGAWASRLAGMPVAEQRQVLTDLVRGHAAAVLGHDSADDVLPQRAFKELGFDSVGAVELRNRLSKEVGVKLASTMVFDHPNATALADYVRGELVGTGGADDGDPVLETLERLAAELDSVDGGADARQDITERMQTLLSRWMRRGAPGAGAEDGGAAATRQTVAGQLNEASADEVLDFINKELGAS
ncbi:type I polyketide synthase [Kitasatospora sp. NPDC057518]|uniref:type I polyketide synthase n=1 Tax=Kitasatospora sp. NPDC057518 TaxID=3346155 RepID=UPI003674D81F